MTGIAHHPQSTSTGWFVVSCAIGMLLWIGAMTADLGDVLRAYPSPERHQNTRSYAIDEVFALALEDRQQSEGDFNGDGVLDGLTVEYFHMKPLFRRATYAMVHIRCGVTEELLFAHAFHCLLDTSVWIGDHDGNGTDDVFVHEKVRDLPPDESRLVFGYLP